MESVDYLVRGITEDGKFRFSACTTTAMANEGRRRHETKSGASKILSETMSAAILLASHLDRDEKLSLQITSDGTVKGVLADIDSEGNVRGFISDTQVYAKLKDMPGGPPPLGTGGTIFVMRSTPGKVLYRGTVPLVAGDIGHDVGVYLTRSEQVASAMRLHSDVGDDKSIVKAGGIVLQCLPGADPEMFDAYRAVIEDEALGARISAEPSPEMAVETLMNAVEHESPYRILTRVELRFHCDCSRAKVADMIRMLGKEDIQKMIREDGQAEVTCRFCNERYVLDKAELSVILGTLNSDVRH